MKIESAKQEAPPVVITLSAEEAKTLANELYCKHPAGESLTMRLMYELRGYFGKSRGMDGQV